jgi:Zn-dependent peptidase ImmA (M78 family)
MIDRKMYYLQMQALANGIREKHGVSTDSLGLSKMRSIYIQEGIKLDLWPHKMKRVRAAYLIEEGQAYVLLNKSIKPVEPRLFALAHELKHHLTDQELAKKNLLGCTTDFASRSAIEIGAELFAAEFIFPLEEFRAWVASCLGSAPCGADEIVQLTRQSPAKISYAFLVKRLEWMGMVARGEFSKFQFVKHEHRLYGLPFYLRRLDHRRTSIGMS